MEEEVKPQLPVEPPEPELPSSSSWERVKINKSKIFVSVLGIFVFAGAVFGAYKLGQRQIQPPQPTPTPAVVATPTPDPTADWQTYTNTEYGYSIKYSPVFELEEVAGVGVEVDEYKGQEICMRLRWEDTSGSMSLSISIAPPEIKGKPIMCFRSGVGAAEDYKEQININNISYLAEGVRDYKLDGGVKNYTGETLHVIFENGFEIEYGGAVFQNEPFEKYLEKKEILLQTLSTFRFLEGLEGEADDWKIYTGIKYGFEIRYPSDWVVEERANEVLFSEGGPTGDNISLRAPEKNIYGDNFWLQIYRIPDIQETSLMDYFKFAHRGNPVIIKSPQVVTIGPNNEEFMKIEESTGGYIGYIKMTNRDYYEISYFNPGVQSLDTEISKILSTFRFLD